MTAGARARGYSLEIEDPRTQATTAEAHISLAAVIARAAKLIQAGYNVGIWSAASLEQQPKHLIGANDDEWTDALCRRLTGAVAI
jgi:hypothetical protein